MKNTINVIAATLLILVISVPASGVLASTQFSTYAPITGIPSGSRSFVFAETVFSTYGTEVDNQWGANQFSIQLNAQYEWACGALNLAQCELGFQSVGSYGQLYPGYFYFTPEIWFLCSNWFLCGDNVQEWAPTIVQAPSTMATSAFHNYVIFLGINTASTGSVTVTVSSCNIGVTVPPSSMYIGIFSINPCSTTAFFTKDLVFPATKNGVNLDTTHLSSMQIGVLGLGDRSQAQFTRSVINMEIFEYNCVWSGCSYTYSSGNPGGWPSYSAESSNTNFYIHNDAGGHHVFECQQSADESVCT